MTRFVADAAIPWLAEAFAPLGEVVPLPAEQLPDALGDAAALLTRSVTRVDADLLARAPSLRFVGSATAGTDHLDLDACRARGVTVASAPGANAGAVGEWVTAALVELALRHHVRLAGQTLAVVGAGATGSQAAARAAALGMHVLRCDPPRARAEGPDGFVALDEALARADVVTLHVPLTDEGPDATRGLLDRRRLSALGGAWLLNASRGEVVDEPALRDAIASGAVGACALDVWAGEPDIDRATLAVVDLATPHIAGYSLDAKAAATGAVREAAARWLGVELSPWLPELPARPTLLVDVSDDLQAAARICIRAACEIGRADRRLRAATDRFRDLRRTFLDGDRARRAFAATEVVLPTGAPEVLAALRTLGFPARR